MSVSLDRFEEFFVALYQRNPFPWQSRLARQVFQQGWPACIDLPTASGKTATIDIAIFVLAAQADKKDQERTVGRRIFFTVDRRMIVDEASKRAFDMARKLSEVRTGILTEVATALRSINADPDAPPLDVTELRGGIYRDRRWAHSVTQPMVIATTADQLGSRLLFRGYGVSPSSRPIHAALVACDSTILLDEAHCTRAWLKASPRFRNTQRWLADRTWRTFPPMHFAQMTATPVGPVGHRFELDEDDLKNEILRAQQNAPKIARLHSTSAKGKKFAAEIVGLAIKAQDDLHQAIGIMVNRVQTARDIVAMLCEKRPQDSCHLVVGRMRPVDRDLLTEKLRSIVGPDRPDALTNPCFVVATQCLEVGADYDFDGLITECASIDALRHALAG